MALRIREPLARQALESVREVIEYYQRRFASLQHSGGDRPRDEGIDFERGFLKEQRSSYDPPLAHQLMSCGDLLVPAGQLIRPMVIEPEAMARMLAVSSCEQGFGCRRQPCRSEGVALSGARG
jgi:hypothetical protein